MSKYNEPWRMGKAKLSGLTGDPDQRIPITDVYGQQVAVVTGRSEAESNAALIVSAPTLVANNAALRTLLAEAYERLGAITELAHKSGADDLRSRIKAKLEEEQ